MSGESLNLILAITSIITTITLIVTLGIVASQTAQLTKQTRLNTVITYHQYYKDVNVALLQNEQAAQRVLGESKEDSIASIIDENKYLYNQRFAQVIDRKLQEIDQEKQNSSMVH